MRVLVTGATGFIGSALTECLLKRGWRVRTATRDARKSLDSTESVIVGEINSTSDWSSAVKGVDLVFHLAGIAHVVNARQQKRTSYNEVNAQGTRTLALAASKAAVKRFVYLSTANVAGGSSQKPFHETDHPQPIDEYALSKLRGEDFVRTVSRGSAMEFSIIRPPLVYGPGVRANFLSLMRAIDRGVPLPLGGIVNLRSYVALTNLVDALVFTATSLETANETMFVSDCEDVSTPDLIRRIALSLGHRTRLFPVPDLILRWAAAALGQTTALGKIAGSLQVDTSKVRAFGWRPVVSLDAGLAATAAWFRGAK